MAQKKHFSFVLIGLLILLAFYSSSATTISHFGKQEGLPKGAINITVQDKDDFLWIGSHDGLYKFDGQSFVKTKDNFLRKANITAGFLDSKGFMWIGTYSGEVFVYDGQVFKKITFSDWQNTPIVEINESSAGKVFIVSKNNGIIEFTSSKDYRLYRQNDTETLIYSAHLLSSNTMLIGTESGLKKIILNGSINLVSSFNILPDVKITKISKSSTPNCFWIGTEDKGVFEINSSQNGEIVRNFSDIIRFPQRISFLIEDAESELWIGSKDQGIMKITLNQVNRSVINIQSFSQGNGWESPVVTNIFRDREGNSWISTFDDGLLKFENEIFPKEFTFEKALERNISTLVQDNDGSFWIGTYKGLIKLKFIDNQWVYIDIAEKNLLSIDKITSLYLNGNILYVGTSLNGVYIYDIKNNSSKQLKFEGNDLVNSIKCFDIPSPDNLWVGTMDGIFIVDIKTNKFKRITTAEGLPHNHINDIEHNLNGRIWIATTGNKVAFYEGGQVNVVSDKKLDISDVNSMCRDANNNIWFATNGKGVFKWNGKFFSGYNQKLGLASDYCYAINSDKTGRIWISHQQGLSRINPKDGEFLKYVGVFGNTSFEFTVNQIVSLENKVWLCTDKGVLHYSDQGEKLARQQPKIVIKLVKIDSTNYDPNFDIELPYQSYSFHFQYSGISLKNPEAVRYKFMLKGYDKGWSDESQVNSQVYNTVNEGEYEFMVLACNEFGIWNENPAVVKIKISKPWYKEWWFYSAVLAAIFMGIYLFIRIRTAKLVSDKRHLEKLVNDRTKELELRNVQILENKEIIEEKAKHITDSIRYAKRIQKAIYPTMGQIKNLFPESFVFFKSKDLVSGDFYWVEELGSKVLFAACDCTGHGVPGAFISIVTNNLLNQTVKVHGITKPALILDEVNKGVTHTLHQTLEDAIVKDGMDAALCCFDRETGILEFAGAYNSMFLVRNGELMEYKADNIAIGRFIGEVHRTFTNHEIPVENNDVIYVFSDGFADQFGGPDGKKIKKNNFKKLIVELSHLPMEEQREKLYNYLKAWQGELEQVDDVLVFGVRIKK